MKPKEQQKQRKKQQKRQRYAKHAKRKAQEIVNKRYDQKQQQLKLRHYGEFWSHCLISRQWPQLKHLEISGVQINSQDSILFSKISFPSLIHFSLENSTMKDQTIFNFCYNQWLLLQTLKIKSCGMSDTAMIALIKKDLPSLTHLQCQWNKITSKSIKKMVFLQYGNNLKYISLGYNKIGCGGIKWFVKLQLINVITLDLNACRLGDEGVKQLTKAKLQKLQKLDLKFNSIGLNGFSQIYGSGWDNLNGIELDYNIQGQMGLIKLVKVKWPKMRLLGISFEDMVKGILGVYALHSLVIRF